MIVPGVAGALVLILNQESEHFLLVGLLTDAFLHNCCADLVSPLRIILVVSFYRALSYLTYIKLCVTYYIRTKQTIPILFEKTVKKYGDKTALICEDQTWTFRQLDLYANSVGHFFLQNGFRTVRRCLSSTPYCRCC